MARYTDKQLMVLKEIGELDQARRSIERDVQAEIERITLERTTEINLRMYPLVNEAIGLGISKARIGKAIGTTAYITYNDLIQRAREYANGTPVPGVEGSAQMHVTDNDVLIVELRNYVLEGQAITGEFEFVEEIYQGNDDEGFIVERALYGDEPNTALREELGVE